MSGSSGAGGHRPRAKLAAVHRTCLYDECQAPFDSKRGFMRAWCSEACATADAAAHPDGFDSDDTGSRFSSVQSLEQGMRKRMVRIAR